MRISDWSSDVCSSDLTHEIGLLVAQRALGLDTGTKLCLKASAFSDFARQRLVLLAQMRRQPRTDHEQQASEKRDLEQRALQQVPGVAVGQHRSRSEEHTSELQSLMRISYAVFCLKNKNT